MEMTELWRKVRRIQIRTSRMVTEAFAGAYLSAFKGRGMEFEDVREYQPGDEVRTIDWNVTARMRYPYVKNFREERELTVMLLVDLSASTLFGSLGKCKRELIAELGAVLAFSAVRNSDKVGLMLFTDRVETYIPPKKGTTAVLRVIRELLAARPQGKGTDIAGALRYFNRVQRRKGVCFLISDFLSKPCSHELLQTASRHDMTALCVTDPQEVDLPNVGLCQICDLETGQMRLIDTGRKEVRERLKQTTESRITANRRVMARSGGSFLDLRTDRDYFTALQQHFALKEKRV